MKVTDIKALCTSLSTEAEDRDERNAYDEIRRHIDQAHLTKALQLHLRGDRGR